ncbi:MAG: hypothetical protein J6X42_00300 [Alphaproteobacteria bacterium]|nr:hypothetical protein [Alphaproteobacteria bacterium]
MEIFILLCVCTVVLGTLAGFYQKKWLWTLLILSGIAMFVVAIKLFREESRWPIFLAPAVTTFLSFLDDKNDNNIVFPISLIILLIVGNVLGFKYDMPGPLAIASLLEFFGVFVVICTWASRKKPVSEYFSEYFAEMYDGPSDNKKK